MKRYIGRRARDGTLHVTARTGDGPEATLDPRLDLRRHSPAGFECGYAGSGPAQLALAVLADCVGAEAALGRYQAFKSTVIARLPRDENWVLTEAEVTAAAGRSAGPGEG